jgi:glycosyltransferase involved in cell wall biosynthesis
MSDHRPHAREHVARPPVAVVICTRDRPGEVAGSLDAVRSVLGPSDALIVVDSASVDRDAVARVAEAAGATVVRVERPGLSRARNAGLAAASAPVIAFTDDDCRPRPGWVDAVAAPFADASVGAVTGPVHADDAGGVEVTTMSDTVGRRVVGWHDPMELVHGANMAFRRDALDGVGGFDELLGAGGRFRAGEDHDMVLRVLVGGWVVVHEPSAVVAHRQWRTRAQVLRLEYGYGIGSGAFAAKTFRLDRAAGRRLLGRRLWSNGIAQAWREVRARHETGAASSALKAAGVVVGAVRAARLPLDGPCFKSD